MGRKSLRAKGAALALFALGIAGCKSGPDYHPPELDLPPSFDNSAAGPTTGPATRPTSTAPVRAVDLARWWNSLDDPVLNSLVDRAIRGNFDLKIAVARVQEAREFEITVEGGTFPLGRFASLDFSATAARGTGNNATRGRTTPALQAGTITSGLEQATHAIGVDAAWEIDLFGRYDRLAEAAGADTQAVVEATNDVLVTLAADVVRAYVEVRSAQFRLEITLQNVESQRRSYDLVRERLNQGVGTDLDVALAERQLDTTLARVRPLEAAIAAAQRRVAVLLGQYPEELRAELTRPAALPATPPRVATGMPVELLRRRPDVRRAERQLAASTARIGVATADLYPKLALTAGAGMQGQGLGITPVESHHIYSIGPTVYWPMLDFGRLEAIVLSQDYRTRQLLYAYQKAVITAVQEVDDALTNYAAEQDRLAELSAAVAASTRAAGLAQQRYENGLTDFLNVLDAQRQVYELQDQYAVAQEIVARQFILLSKALGGGWEGYDIPPPPGPRPAVIAAADRLLHGGKPSQAKGAE